LHNLADLFFSLNDTRSRLSGSTNITQCHPAGKRKPSGSLVDVPSAPRTSGACMGYRGRGKCFAALDMAWPQCVMLRAAKHLWPASGE